MPQFWSNASASIQEVDLIETGQVKPTAKNSTVRNCIADMKFETTWKIQNYYLKSYQVLPKLFLLNHI